MQDIIDTAGDGYIPASALIGGCKFAKRFEGAAFSLLLSPKSGGGWQDVKYSELENIVGVLIDYMFSSGGRHEVEIFAGVGRQDGHGQADVGLIAVGGL